MKPRLAALALVTLLVACGDDPPPPTEPPPAPRDPFVIVAGPELMNRVKVAPLQETEVRETIRVPGRLDVNETKVARLGSPVTGRVTEVEVREGEDVKRGQILATLTSTELSNTQLEYLRAFTQRIVADRAAERARQLQDADVIGSAELQRRQAERDQSTADLNAAADRLKVLGMSERAIARLAKERRVDSSSQIVASIDGTVIERRISPGQVVQPADTVYVIADLSDLWIVADVPETIAGTVRVGQTVEVEVPALPENRLRGQLSFVAATVNPDTRSVRVRMDVPNSGRQYKPAMLATVLIQGSPQRRRVIPSSAIVREDNRDYAFVQTAEGTFALRQVSLGDEYEDQRVVLTGLRPDETVVVEGAFHLNNERRRRALSNGE